MILFAEFATGWGFSIFLTVYCQMIINTLNMALINNNYYKLLLIILRIRMSVQFYNFKNKSFILVTYFIKFEIASVSLFIHIRCFSIIIVSKSTQNNYSGK